MSDKLQAAFIPPSKEQINGLIGLYSAGRYQEALIVCRGLARQYPQIPFFPNLLGIIQFHQGNQESAMASFKKALALNPDYDEVHNNMGNVLKDLGRYEEALACYHNALRIKPDYAEAHNNLATVLIELRQPDEAISAFKQAIAIKPDYARAYHNLGDLMFDLERYDEAISYYEKALQIEPDSYELLINYSIVLIEKGRNEEALISANKAVQIKPDNAKAHNNLANAFKAIGQSDKALSSYIQAVTIEPDNELYMWNISDSLATLTFFSYTEQWADIFQNILKHKIIVRPSFIVVSIVNLLKQQSDIQDAFLAANTSGVDKQMEEICVKLSGIPLLLDILALCPIPDLELEYLLTVLRKNLLLNGHLVSNKSEIMRFQVALALNCFTNEFIFDETDAETQAVEALKKELEVSSINKEELDAYKIACLASYCSLNNFNWLPDSPVPEGLELLYERQVKEVKAEEQIRSKIQSVKKIKNKVSAAVQQQYEENPYPRWVNTQVLSRPFTISNVVKDLELKLTDPTITFANDPDILIAGCGTGQHSIGTASRFSNCKVLAIDLSLSSLSYAIRKTTELGIENIEYKQADILDLGLLNKQFDIVESAGVLHHMDDPMAGWTVLADCLKSGGLMKIALYSETARQHVVKARELISERGLSSKPDDMKKFRREINASDDELLSKLRNYRDLFSLSELRDLLFHVQEHRFTLPQIKGSLETLGLNFIGFDQVNREYVKKFKQVYTDPDAIYDLDTWHEFEQNNPDVFSGMYQFWLQKNT